MLQRPTLEHAVRRALARSRGVVLAGPRQAGKTTLAQRFCRARFAQLLRPGKSPACAALGGAGAGARLAAGAGGARRGAAAARVVPPAARPHGPFGHAGPVPASEEAPRPASRGRRASPCSVAWKPSRSAASTCRRSRWTRGRGPATLPTGCGCAAAFRGPGSPRRRRTAWRGGKPRSRSTCRTTCRSSGLGISTPTMLRFWTMLAHYHGQVWSAADPARSLGVSDPTVAAISTSSPQTMMVRQLQPWHENLGKRQVKAPKVYFRDTGLLHALMELGACRSSSRIRAPARAGRASRWNRCFGLRSRSRPSSGPRTRARSSTC